MPTTICLSTSIQKPKDIVRKAVLEGLDIFKDHIIPESKSCSADHLNFSFEISSTNFSVPISDLYLSIEIQDFPIHFISYLKVTIRYNLNKKDWRTRFENRFSIRPLINRNGKDALSHFKKKVEKQI